MEYLNDTDSLKSSPLDIKLTIQQIDLLKDLKTIHDLYKNGILTKSNYEYSIALSTEEVDLDFDTISSIIEDMDKDSKTDTQE